MLIPVLKEKKDKIFKGSFDVKSFANKQKKTEL
jgi:hypothetical protein